MRLPLGILLTAKKAFPNVALVERAIDRFWESFWRDQESQERESTNEAPERGIRGSERATLFEVLATQWPFRSLLEVGCGFGQNAHVLHDLFPTVRYVGIDIDQTRVDEGEKLLHRSGVGNAKVVTGNGLELSAFPDSSVDIVLSSAYLLYVSDDDIRTALLEMHRVAKKAILLLEQHDRNLSGQGSVISEGQRPDYWVRNYEVLLRELFPSCRLETHPVNAPRWNLERWKELGTVFVVHR